MNGTDTPPTGCQAYGLDVNCDAQLFWSNLGIGGQTGIVIGLLVALLLIIACCIACNLSLIKGCKDLCSLCKKSKDYSPVHDADS